MEHELLHAALGQWRYLFEYADPRTTPSTQSSGSITSSGSATELVLPAELVALLERVDQIRLAQLAALCHQASRVLHLLDTWTLTEHGAISGVSPLSRAVARALSSYVIAQIYRAFSEEDTFSERTTAGVLVALDQLTALKSLFDLLLEIDRSVKQQHVSLKLTPVIQRPLRC